MSECGYIDCCPVEEKDRVIEHLEGDREFFQKRDMEQCRAISRNHLKIEELQSQLAEIAGLPIIWMEVERLMRKRGLITEANAIASCIAELQAIIHKEKSE